MANLQNRYSARMAAQDSVRMKMAYVHMHDCMDELARVWNKDNVIAHMVRQLGAMEDTLWQYVVPERGRSK